MPVGLVARGLGPVGKGHTHGCVTHPVRAAVCCAAVRNQLAALARYRRCQRSLTVGAGGEWAGAGLLVRRHVFVTAVVLVLSGVGAPPLALAAMTAAVARLLGEPVILVGWGWRWRR